MGRANRQHWTAWHPDQKLWTPHQRALAGSMSQEAYEAVYGRGGPPKTVFSRGAEHLLLRKPGRYKNFGEARARGEGVVAFRIEEGGVSIENLSEFSRNRGDGISSFALHGRQIDNMLEIAEASGQQFPGRSPASWKDLWGAGRVDLWGGVDVASAHDGRPAEKIIAREVASMNPGDTKVFDTAGRVRVSLEAIDGQSQPRYIIEGSGRIASSQSSATEVVHDFACQQNAIISPRLVRHSGSLGEVEEIGEAAGTKIFSEEGGSFIIESDGQETLRGWFQHGELFLFQRADGPVRLSEDEALLLYQWTRSVRGDGQVF